MSARPPATMGPITDVADRELRWLQPQGLKQHHELRSGDQIVATVDLERGTLAAGRSEHGSWTFKREGFWHPLVTVRAAGSEQNVAVFRPHWAGGGELTFADGHSYDLKTPSLWHSEWDWHQQDEVLVRTRRPGGLLKSNGVVEIAEGARQLPDLALLVLLGWYLMLLYARDMAVETAAVVAAAH